MRQIIRSSNRAMHDAELNTKEHKTENPVSW